MPPLWDDFVSEHPAATLYHRADWCTMVEEVFGHQTQYIVAYEDEAICAALPLTSFRSMLFGNLAISLPYVNYGGPLFESDGCHVPLFDYLKSYRADGNFKSVEIRFDKKLSTTAKCKTHKVTFFLDLPSDPDELMKSFKAKLRSQVRRPMKEDMYARSGGEALLPDFYSVFTQNMRDLGTPPLPQQFFREILERFPDNAHIVNVYASSGEVAAASFLIRYNGTMEIPWASSIRRFNRFSPNMLLYWESFKVAIEQGCKRFDFGRCSPDGGTYRFKKQWGAQESQLYWYYITEEDTPLPEMNPNNSKFDLMIKMWQKLPLPVTRIVGNRMIKHIP